MGELGVVVRVAELVSGRLRRVDAAAPVEEDQRAVVDERHAERAATLAGAGPGVDPLLVDGAVDESTPEPLLYELNAPRTMPNPSVHEIELGANGSGANRSYHGNAAGRPCSPALASIQRRRSGSDASMAACIASNVARLMLLANSDASIGLFHPRRRFTVFASPFTAFIAAAQVTATFGHARSSAS